MADLAQLRNELAAVKNGGEGGAVWTTTTTDPQTSMQNNPKTTKSPIVKAAKLNLTGEYIETLTYEASLLNQEFLANSKVQFSEYLGLSMIQKVFENSVASPSFVKLFEQDSSSYQSSLDAKLLMTYQLVED